MPLQKRLPKYGFSSRLAFVTAEIRLSELNLTDASIIDMAELRKAGLIKSSCRRAKVFASGEIKRAISLKGVAATKGAAAAIKEAGGEVEG